MKSRLAQLRSDLTVAALLALAALALVAAAFLTPPPRPMPQTPQTTHLN